MTSRKRLVIGIGAVTLAFAGAIAAVLLRDLLDGKRKVAKQVLDPGWQFYSKPTTMEPPGSLFRIDAEGVRYQVGRMEVELQTGKEVMGRVQRRTEVDSRVLAGITGLRRGVQAEGTGRATESIQFEMIDTQREVLTDLAIDALLTQFKRTVTPRKGNRYFVIREARSASEMRYTISEESASRMGGDVALTRSLKAEGHAFVKTGSEYNIEQKFQERMRVMFLPEEIVISGASLSGLPPEFEVVPVRWTLTWKEDR
jgi:hypothetical protein